MEGSAEARLAPARRKIEKRILDSGMLAISSLLYRAMMYFAMLLGVSAQVDCSLGSDRREDVSGKINVKPGKVIVI